MMAVAIAAHVQHDILQIRHVRHASAAEEVSGDRVVGELTFAQVPTQPAFGGHHRGENERCGRDAAGIATVAAICTNGVVQDFVGGDDAGAGHHALRHRAAVEEDALVIIVTVVIIPIQASGDVARGEAQRVHGHGVAHVHLATGGEAAVVEHRQDDAGADAVLDLQLDPATQRQGVEIQLLDDLVEHHGQPDDLVDFDCRHLAEVRVVDQPLGLLLIGAAARSYALHAVENLGEVLGLHGDVGALQRQFIDAHGFEGRGAGADGADHHVLHAADDAADAVEMIDEGGETQRTGGDRVGFQRRELDVVLVEDVHDGTFSAEGIAARYVGHLVQLIGIRLDEDGHVRFFERGHGTGFIAEVGERENHAVELAAVLAQPVGVDRAFFGCLHCAEARGTGIHHERVMAEVVQDFDHLSPCCFHQRSGEEPPVSEVQRESRPIVFSHGNNLLLCKNLCTSRFSAGCIIPHKDQIV